jgi:hypothetical protein
MPMSRIIRSQESLVLYYVNHSIVYSKVHEFQTHSISFETTNNKIITIRSRNIEKICVKMGIYISVSKFLVTEWGDIIDYGIQSFPVRQPYARVDYIPQSGTKNLASLASVDLFIFLD